MLDASVLDDGVEEIHLTGRITTYVFTQLTNTAEIYFANSPFDEPDLVGTAVVLPIPDVRIQKTFI